MLVLINGPRESADAKKERNKINLFCNVCFYLYFLSNSTQILHLTSNQGQIQILNAEI